MKKIILPILGISLFAISCQNENKEQVKNTVNTAEVKIDSSSIKKQEAIKILDEVNKWMEKGVKKTLTSKKVNKQINPLMEKYQQLLKKMNKRDSTSIQNYRVEQINKIIDLQIQQN